MNNGLYGFPSSNYGSSVISVTEFDSSGTYIIPNGAKRLWIMLIGGGGGGGSGARLGSGTNTFGGGGGAGGTINTGYYFVNAIGASLESIAVANPGFTPGSWARSLVIVIGAGGNAGTAITADSTNGNPGGAGNPSTVTLSGTPGFMMYSSGGNAGSGGTNTSGAAGAGQQMLINGIPVATTYLTTGAQGQALANGNPITVSQYANTGGAGGGGINTANGSFNGGSINAASNAIISAINNPFIVRGGTIKSGGLAASSTSQPFQPLTIAGPYTPGLGGQGGGASTTTAANNGGGGYRGGGGGGGGGSRNTFNSGAGGIGGNGYCVIVALGL